MDPQSPPAPDDFPRNGTLRNLSLFGLIIAAGLATRPFVDLGFNDDWDFTRLAMNFAQRHQIVYSGWSAVALLVQVVYGALLSTLFGGTYTVYRLGTLFVSGFL